MTKNEKILVAIQSAFSNGMCDWADIVESVKQAKIPVKNWLVVRGVLQWMINEKMVVRIKNIHQEQYTTNVEVSA
ncbi:MAG: hypothetical protein ACOYOX_07295 [Limnohabitans sp.]|jgi:hypothetical protein